MGIDQYQITRLGLASPQLDEPPDQQPDVRISTQADQKPGNIPLADCINNTTTPTPFGPGCWQILFFPPEPAHDEVEVHVDSNDTRMQQTWYVNGMLWGATDTAVWVNGA